MAYIDKVAINNIDGTKQERDFFVSSDHVSMSHSGLPATLKECEDDIAIITTLDHEVNELQEDVSEINEKIEIINDKSIIPSGENITKYIRVMTESDYNALTIKDNSTLYFLYKKE